MLTITLRHNQVVIIDENKKEYRSELLRVGRLKQAQTLAHRLLSEGKEPQDTLQQVAIHCGY